jgi:putative restriction endonuclease
MGAMSLGIKLVVAVTDGDWFDTGYVTVTPDLHFEVSGRIREEFENGRHYYDLHGQPLMAPARPEWRPDPAKLAWHNEQRFLG